MGSIVRVLIDYTDYVPLCAKLKSALEVQREWPEIRQIIGKNESLLDFKFSLFTVLMCGCECDCVLLSVEELTISNDHSRPEHPSHTKFGMAIPIPAKGKK